MNLPFQDSTKILWEVEYHRHFMSHSLHMYINFNDYLLTEVAQWSTLLSLARFQKYAMARQKSKSFIWRKEIWLSIYCYEIRFEDLEKKWNLNWLHLLCNLIYPFPSNHKRIVFYAKCFMKIFSFIHTKYRDNKMIMLS